MHRDLERLALLGWALYPCSRTSRAGLWKGSQGEATSDLNTLALWAREHPGCNWRVVFGRSGVWGLDVDSTETHAHDGIASMARLVAENGPLPVGPRARSGGGGVLLFYRANIGLNLVGSSDRLGAAWAGIDPKRGAQTQTIPPSIHTTTGRAYRWIVAPWEVSPPDAPGWLLTALRTPPPPPVAERFSDGERAGNAAHEALNRAAFAISDAREGGRNIVLNRRAWTIGKLIGAGLLDEDRAVDTLYAAARAAGLDGMEAAATIHSAIKAGRRTPLGKR